MRTNIATGSLINFPFFYVDNIAQRLQAAGAVIRSSHLMRWKMP